MVKTRREEIEERIESSPSLEEKHALAREFAYKDPYQKHTIWNKDFTDIAQNYVKGYFIYGHSMPSEAGLAEAIGTTVSQLREWSETRPRLSQLLETISVHQEVFLLNAIDGGKYSAPIAKLLLSKHGYCGSEDTQDKGNDTPVNMTVVPIASNNNR